MLIRESYVNRTEHYRCGESDWYTPFTVERKPLFQALQREHGRCTGQVYIEQLQVNGRMAATAIGWVFEKRDLYEDTKQPYLRETWVELDEEETQL